MVIEDGTIKYFMKEDEPANVDITKAESILKVL